MLLFQNKNTELYENHLVSTETITMVKQQLCTSGCHLKSPGTKRLGGSSPGTKEWCHWKVKSHFSDAQRSLTFACVFTEFSELVHLHLVWCGWPGDWGDRQCGVDDRETGLHRAVQRDSWNSRRKKKTLLPQVAVDGWWLLEKDFQQGWVGGTLLTSVISKPRVCVASSIQ